MIVAQGQADADRAAREQALEPGESILLQAPAGSGKTEVLTQRFLRLLATVQEPEEILAITFTRKAAAEMRARILRVLDGEIDPRRPTASRLQALRQAALARAAQRGWDLQELRGRLRIQTIDSLNHELARTLPLLGGGPAALSVTDDAEALYLDAARRTLHEAEESADYQDAMDLVFRRLDNNWGRAEELLAGMLQKRAQWLRTVLQFDAAGLAGAVERGLEAIVRDALTALVALLPQQLREQAAQLLRVTAGFRFAAAPADTEVNDAGAAWRSWLQPQAALTSQPERLRDWQALAGLLLTQQNDWRKQFTVREGLPREEKAAKAGALALLEECTHIAGLRALLESVRRLPDPRLGADEAAALEALANLLRLAAANLQIVFNRAGRVDHTEVSSIARIGLVALESPTELALRRAATLKHLLIDEFQDTSVEQNGLLETLIVGWEPGADCSLFAVGDPMQSIYQFRSAEVGLFLRAREYGIGDLPLTSLRLTRNFRSRGNLIDWCNTSFAAMFPPADDLRESAVSFLPADRGTAPDEPAQGDATSGEATSGEVIVHRLASESREAEAVLLAAQVLAARRCRPGCTVAVLVQAASHAPPIIAALRRQGLAARGVELEPLARQPAVRDIVELGCALLHAGDRVAWLSTLRAPFCGLSLADLLVLTANSPDDTPIAELLADAARLAVLSPDGRQRLARCAPLLQQAWATRARGDFVATLRLLWESLGGPAALQTIAEWQQVEAYLDALTVRLQEIAAPEGGTLRELAESLKLGGEAQVADSIDVLTIHKAKGLEWDVVLLPGLHRRLRGDDRPLLSWIELPRPDRDADLLMAALSIGRNRDDDRLGDYIAHLRKQRQKHERCRLAYVAGTRAREELHLFAHAGVDKEGNARPRANSLLQTFWPALGRYFDSQGAVASDVQPEAPFEAPGSPPVDWRLRADWRPPAPPPPPTVPRFAVGAEADSVLKPEYLWAGQRRRAIGTVVHAELEHMARGDQQDAVKRRSAWRTHLRELGLGVEQLDRAVEDVAGVIGQLAGDENARWILSAAHAETANELRLSGIVGGQLRDVVLDRTFVAQGVRWVVDYKTGTHQGADLEGFLAAELERYRPQLALYAHLAAGLGPQPVRVALYFPLLRRLVELPLAAAG